MDWKVDRTVDRTADRRVDQQLDRQLDSELLCLGVSWADGAPALDLSDVGTAAAVRVPLLTHRLGYRVATPGRFCTGSSAFVPDENRTARVPCPNRRPAVKSGQCGQCAARDEFKFAHRFHTGGYASPALTRYMAQPHWLYIATFADGSSKVGTAVDQRKRTRLDEQGAIMASYVARAADGKSVRIAEDSVTSQLAVTQYRRRNAKTAALASPAPHDTIAANHTRTVERATELLAAWKPDSGITPVTESWTPPAELNLFRDRRPTGGWTAYPNDLKTGDHGFVVEACSGPAVLARIESAADAPRYIADLGELKGARIILGDYASSASMFQDSLF